MYNRQEGQVQSYNSFQLLQALSVEDTVSENEQQSRNQKKNK